ncbi:MAG: Formate dehydrogenase, nitrate-inducible, iron-sulfur subunit [Syntrophus sp. PtaB.Bin075]|nr:MAG: Formate dehydrogenase, nitrate-inducible, iron-sulfur subunit [Syntrophus sp. PtaB.Bin075]
MAQLTIHKAKLIDVAKCTGCRGCQLACKQWNSQPARQTENSGSYQNPPDLQWNTWTLIRFKEIEASKPAKGEQPGDVKWLFRKDGCMHCTDAACVKVCPSGALHYTPYGSVDIDQSKCIGCKECVSACPFNIPRYDRGTDKVYKCTLCTDRIAADMIPACAKACPTGAIKFGDRDAMLKIAAKRVEELKEQGHKDASVYGEKFVGGTHVMYVLDEKPEVYDLPKNPSVPISVILWKDILKPLSLLSAGGVIAGSFLHYIIHGPKLPDEDQGQEAKGGE